MNESLTLRRLRTFLLGLAAVLFVGSVVELVLAEHTESPSQLATFALCGLGLLALVALRMHPGRRTLLALRIAMGVVAVGSLVGIGLHFWGNLELGRETQPNADAATLLVTALTGGVPLLAPGILAVSATLAIAATYSASDET
jgi:hypothetical protein